MIITAIIVAIGLIFFARALRKGLDESLWHEANMYVTPDDFLIVIGEAGIDLRVETKPNTI